MVSSSSIGEEVEGRSVPGAELLVQPHLPLYIYDEGYGRSWKDPGREMGQLSDWGIYISGVRLKPSGSSESRGRNLPLPGCFPSDSRWLSEN